MQRATPKSKPLEAKAKAHKRAVLRAKKQTQEYLREKANGSATIGRIDRNTRIVSGIIKQPHRTEDDLAKAGLCIDLMRMDWIRLNKIMPALKSVELTGTDNAIEINVTFPDA